MATQSSTSVDGVDDSIKDEEPAAIKSERKPPKVQRSNESTTGSTQSTEKTSNLPNERLEVRFNSKDLETLRTAFVPVDADPKKPTEKPETLRLAQKEFVQKLSALVKKGSEEEYAELFDRIDITKDGLVTWDMFVQFLLYEFHEKDEKVKTTQVPQWKEIKTIPTPHKDVIQRIQHVRSSNRYLSVSREGCISFWDQHMKLHRTLKMVTDSVKPRDLWVTDFVLLHTLNKIAVSFTSKEIAFYDLSSKVDFNCQYKLIGLKSTPLCLDFYSNPEDANEAILVYGDVGGQVSALCFSSAQIALFDRPQRDSSESKQAANNATVLVKLKELIRDTSKHNNCRFVHHVGHKGWVRQVKYAEHLECFISCSTGREKTIILGFIEKASNTMRTTSFRFFHGVHCFDYHQEMNLIATGSVNNHVCLWNPYVISKPVGILTGHMDAVIKVTINLNRQQLMSFSVDKVLRIWDIQQQVCLQRIAGIFPKGPKVQTILYFDDIKNRLFVTFNYQLTMLEMKIEVRDRVMSHERPVTSAIYNSLYNQVVSACQEGTVTIWMVDTGQKVKQFPNCHGNNEITSLALDNNQTRLLTGSTDGTVKIWDFNGHCHHLLKAGRDNPVEISQVLVLRRSILAVGWDKYITVFRSVGMTQYHLDPVDWKGGQEHQDDILTAAYSSPTTLATGSYDGEIVIWNTTSETASRKLQARSKQKLIRRPITGDADPLSRPTTSESQASELEFSFVISSLIFLKTRMPGGNSNGECADLISCGGGGWVRFWNTHLATLCAEFVAHPHAGNVIGNTDSENKYLITADSDGTVKAWELSNYLVKESGFRTAPPPLHSSWQPHGDTINSIDTCVRSNRLLVITASSDCSVSMYDIEGHHIGEFGQDHHWRIDVIPEPEKEEEVDTDEEEKSNYEVELERILKEDTFSLQDETDGRKMVAEDTGFDSEFRAVTWDTTVLGKAYQESRLGKRERKQPSVVPGFKEYVEESAVGPYGILDYNELAPMPTMKKPDFMLHPHKYFGEKTQKQGMKKGEPEAPLLMETRSMLKAAFDEKTLFSKELLDFEAQVRNEHAQKLKSNARRSKQPVSILKSFISTNIMGASSNSLGGSKMGSRIGSSVPDKKTVLKSRSSTVTKSTAD